MNPSCFAATRSRPSSPTLARVLAGDLCSGCGGCAAVAPDKIAMGLSSAGFLRPVQSAVLEAAEETRLRDVCPGNGLLAQRSEAHPLWGPVASCRIGHATDDAVRHAGASGGALTALLLHLLQTGTVDAVLQVAADPARPLANRVLASRSAEEVIAAAGSRYAPSAPLAKLEAALREGRRFAFVGKPCDVAALRALARDDARIDRQVPLMLSFFCGGVPSEAGAREIVTRLGAEPQSVRGFRYRGRGWPGFATATLADGTERRMSYGESWGEVLTRHVQFRCRICPDGSGGFADVAVGDAWHLGPDGRPVLAEAPGQSLILSRTAAGERLVLAALASGRLDAEAFPVEAISAIQPGQAHRRRLVWGRLLALRLACRPAPHYRGFRLGAAARGLGVRPNLTNFLGTLRRVYRKR